MQNSPEEDKWSANSRDGSIQVGGRVGRGVSSGLRAKALYHWPHRYLRQLPGLFLSSPGHASFCICSLQSHLLPGKWLGLGVEGWPTLSYLVHSLMQERGTDLMPWGGISWNTLQRGQAQPSPSLTLAPACSFPPQCPWLPNGDDKRKQYSSKSFWQPVWSVLYSDSSPPSRSYWVRSSGEWEAWEPASVHTARVFCAHQDLSCSDDREIALTWTQKTWSQPCHATPSVWPWASPFASLGLSFPRSKVASLKICQRGGVAFLEHLHPHLGF